MNVQISILRGCMLVLALAVVYPDCALRAAPDGAALGIGTDLLQTRLFGKAVEFTRNTHPSAIDFQGGEKMVKSQEEIQEALRIQIS